MFKKAIFFTTLATASFLVTGALRAATSPVQGLVVTPALSEVKLSAGKPATLQIAVTNPTSRRLSVKTAVADFLAQGEDGTPRILGADYEEPNPHSLKDWLSLPARFELAAKTTKQLSVRIGTPKNATPGGHYALVRFTPLLAALENAQGLNLTANIDTLVLAEVSGRVTTEVGLGSFEVSRNGRAGKSFEGGPLTFQTRLSNRGNSHVQPRGQIRVKNVFGQEVATADFNPTYGHILPGSIRKFEQMVDKSFWLGRYQVELDLSYGDGQTLSATTSFWAIPYKPVLIIVGGIIFLAVISRHMYLAGLERASTQPKRKKL